MNPKILHGRSFRGAAAYLLKGAKNDPDTQRVAWTMTRNLATQNPDTAWRVMAAIAMDAPERKKAAGIKATGRKQKNVVKHLVLSWHPEEKDTLTRDDMEAAIEGALAAIGAQDQEALVIAHNDTAHPHVHVLINRTMHDGRLLDDSNEWNNLSDWALEYQRQRGQDYSPQRELNAEARKRGDNTKYRKTPRRLIELNKLHALAANDNVHRRTAMTLKHMELARAQAARSYRLKRRHQRQWTDLQTNQIALRQQIKEEARKGQAKARTRIIEAFRPQWRVLKETENEERRQFEAREKSTFGRLSNLFRNVDIGKSAVDGDKPSVLSQLWNGIGSSENRRAMLQKHHDRRRQQLEIQQRKVIRAEMLPVITQYNLAMASAKRDYDQARTDLTFIQNGERAKNKADWNNLINRRERDFAQLAHTVEPTPDFNDAADPNSFIKKITDRARIIAQKPRAPSNDNDFDHEPEE